MIKKMLDVTGLKLQMRNLCLIWSIALWFSDRNTNGKQTRATFLMFLKVTAFNLKIIKKLFSGQLFLFPPSCLSPPTHIHSLNPLTCITRCTTWAAMPYMWLSARCKCLKLPGAQIISLTSLKTHETLHRRALSLPLPARPACLPQSSDASHPSSSQMGRSYHISFIFA